LGGELDSLIVPKLLFLPNVTLDIFDTVRDSSMSTSGAEASSVGAARGIEGLIEGTERISVGITGTGGI